uniref:DNA sulfur modification protein DndD n=1 Tax=Candidatus Kentrum sp. MB TaxID=2138164 RepID=A0A450X6M4_9GAMM|nr:MAG: DNA sulfur modification protein DndD [Candidatus Kentron sp. MB]VFK30086.1 MAG: DNA sulfur modification protein DndD [Candidatus Kentron sp. MB]VFK75050.1 MAG: DNA sulfur modification protein DndD [Candidatus Kentron sp. MB]
MHLVEIHLRNWRSYRNTTFKFPRPNEKTNIILIGAQNGTGKTSLLMALYLGLFGRESIRLVEGFRFGSNDSNSSYSKLLERIVHRPAIDKNENLYASIRLKFDTPDSGQVVITRTWHFSRQGKIKDLNSPDGEEVRIEVEGQGPKSFPNWKDANTRVEELLFPWNVMPCFFFDGEQAQERVEAAGGKALLDAVNTLYGTGILDQLSQSLKTFIANERVVLRRDVGDVKESELDRKRKERDKREEELADIQDALKKKRQEKDKAVEQEERSRLDLTNLVGDKTADVEEYSGKIRALESEQRNLQQDLSSGLSALALPLAMSKLAHRVVGIVQSEQIRDRWLLLKEEAGAKAEKIVWEVLPDAESSDINPPLTDPQTAQLRTKLEKALESLWSPPPDGCADDYTFPFLREADRAAILNKIRRHRAVGIPDVVEAANNWTNTNNRLKKIRRSFEQVRDTEPQLQKLKKEMASAGEQVQSLGREVDDLERREQGLRNSLNELVAAIGQMEKKRTKAGPVQEKLEVAERVRSIVTDAKSQLIPLCRKTLEERCTHHFQNMISDEYQKFRVRFGDKFGHENEPQLKGPDNKTSIYVTSLSGAQKRAFGLAFTLAIADVSGQQAPIVVDTPVGNMDSEYRGRVLGYVAKAAPGQVFFLSHDEEISAEYRQQLETKIAKTFLIEFEKFEEGSGISNIIEDRYFEGARS